ncbi:uncharacterized protein LOC135498076 [Lineus longissimus]|uniref:uncharacterized protein LOC135498076 n=1 Tax=Lineus longissimus TaxID=88925 RepID=UPI00315C5669
MHKNILKVKASGKRFAKSVVKKVRRKLKTRRYVLRMIFRSMVISLLCLSFILTVLSLRSDIIKITFVFLTVTCLGATGMSFHDQHMKFYIDKCGYFDLEDTTIGRRGPKEFYSLWCNRANPSFDFRVLALVISFAVYGGLLVASMTVPLLVGGLNMVLAWTYGSWTAGVIGLWIAFNSVVTPQWALVFD